MKVYALNTIGAGLDTIGLINESVEISGIIGLTEREANDTISGYVYQKPFCDERRLEFIPVTSYALSERADRERLESLEIDVLFVAGWQRLVPDWLIRSCRICVVGVHGSPYGITGGRGRSPQNWAFILGEREFHVSIFKIDLGIDSGDIIDTASYRIDEHDDIHTSYLKVSWLVSQMLIRSLTDSTIEQRRFTKQNESEAFYLPQRLPEDGAIDWHLPSARVRDFVRALTTPYPGAFSTVGAKILRVWRAIPFDVPEIRASQPGEIVKIFNDGDLLVRAGDGFLLIQEYTLEGGETASPLREGEVLDSDPFAARMELIADRHRKKCPELRLAPSIGIAASKLD